MSLVEPNIYGKIFFLPLLNKHHPIPLLARTTPSVNIPSHKYLCHKYEILSQQMQRAIKPQNITYSKVLQVKKQNKKQNGSCVIFSATTKFKSSKASINNSILINMNKSIYLSRITWVGVALYWMTSRAKCGGTFWKLYFCPVDSTQTWYDDLFVHLNISAAALDLRD